jgi:hypothetical protein
MAITINQQHQNVAGFAIKNLSISKIDKFFEFLD